MGLKPMHEGIVTVKDGDNWKNIGTVVACVNGDNSVSGVLTIDETEYQFRAWKRKSVQS